MSRREQTTREDRMRTLINALTTCLFALLLASIAVGQAQGQGYKLVDTVKIGGEGGWDYLTVDTAAHRLYISRGTHVQVFDIESKTVVGDIPNTTGVHGIALAPELGRGFTSNGRDSSVTVFDLNTLKTLTTIKMQARNPDAILFDHYSGRLFTFNGGSSNTTVIDAKADSIVGYLALEGRPEFAVADGEGKIFVNLEDKSSLVAFESQTLKIIGRWPLAPGENPSGLAMDCEHKRLFSGCANKLMIVLDADSGRVLASLPIGKGVDATGYDPATDLAFSSNGEGTLTIVSEDTPDKFSVVENVPTQRGSRTMALDEKSHRIYLAGATFGPPPPPTPDHPRPRPTMEPGSFVILILERQ
jgi:DNA-binding beta-propeller fold protein YncE